jgi:hypothetical protein
LQKEKTCNFRRKKKKVCDFPCKILSSPSIRRSIQEGEEGMVARRQHPANEDPQEDGVRGDHKKMV